jgi:hypothetical protein
MGDVVRWVFAPTTNEIPAELHIAHICDQFHCSVTEYEQHGDRYDLWFMLLNQERVARKVEQDGWKDIPADWMLAYQDDIPDGLEMDELRELKKEMG